MINLKGCKRKCPWYYSSVTHCNIVQPLMPRPLKIFCPSGVPTKIVNEFLIASVGVTSLAYSSRLDVAIIIIFPEEYTKYVSSYCAVFSSLLLLLSQV